MGIRTTLGEFALLFLQLFQSVSISYIEIVVHFVSSQSDTFKRYWLMQDSFSTLKVLSWNLATLCVSFYRIRKVVGFLLKPNLIPKLHLLKPNALLSIMVTIIVVIMVIAGKG